MSWVNDLTKKLIKSVDVTFHEIKTSKTLLL